MNMKGIYVKLPGEQIFNVDNYAKRKGMKKYRAFQELIDIGLKNTGE